MPNHPARWWHDLGDGRIQCDLCPRHCRLHEGQRAFCFVRQNLGGGMVLTTYGKSTGFCVDPIEKKPLYHFYPGSRVLSLGTAGCNLGCRFCQNWTTTKAREVELFSHEASPEQIAHSAVRLRCPSVALTYNDPVIWAEFALDIARACHDLGLRTVAVTAGYIEPEARRDFFAHMDATNVDLKAFRESFYQKLCFAHLVPVLETLKWIRNETRVWLEVTNLLIPGHNDTPTEIDQLCEWLLANLGPDVPLHFTAFHPDFMMMDTAPTPPATLNRARARALELGLRYVYTGNIWDPLGQATFCAGCGRAVIERAQLGVEEYRLDGSCCKGCGQDLPGRFGEPPKLGLGAVPHRVTLLPVV